MATIHFGPTVSLSHGAVVINPRALLDDRHDATVQAVRDAIEVLDAATARSSHPLIDAWCGGAGPLYRFDGTLEQYRVALANALQREAEWLEWQRFLRRRRREFDAVRDVLRQQMLDAGMVEVCSACGTDQDITIDHIVAISNLGSDDLGNLQFLCRSCNSKKGCA